MSNDSIYGNHGVTIIGYRIYKQYSTILGVEVCTNTINMLQMYNGWSDTVTYYDFESSNGHAYVFNN